ncbi:16062_t:CDS:2, partial [Entrophospora sp. SA101]
MNSKELQEDHPVWHYFYLCTLVICGFIALFVMPVVFSILTAIGAAFGEWFRDNSKHALIIYDDLSKQA